MKDDHLLVLAEIPLCGDPYYAPALQAKRLAKFANRKLTYTRYVDMAWMVEQSFEFPHGLEAQWVNIFLELNGKIYPSLIMDFMHLVGDNLIHKMYIYSYNALWKYQDDHNTVVNLDLSDNEGNEDQGDQDPRQQFILLLLHSEAWP
ncbi:hypothetical protein Lal_00018524 [Lupinus albus]|nr:hypothetical protein Lal_00018524 [Lupinus albus]